MSLKAVVDFLSGPNSTWDNWSILYLTVCKLKSKSSEEQLFAVGYDLELICEELSISPNKPIRKVAKKMKRALEVFKTYRTKLSRWFGICSQLYRCCKIWTTVKCLMKLSEHAPDITGLPLAATERKREEKEDAEELKEFIDVNAYDETYVRDFSLFRFL